MIVVKLFQSPLNWTCSSHCLHTVYNTIQYNTYVYTTSTVNGASLTYGLRVFLHFFLHFSVWVAHHLQSPLSISSMSSLPFRRVSHDGRPFESQWVEGLKREPVLCRHLSSVPSIALARYLVALGMQLEEPEEIHDAQIQSDMFLKHPGTSVTAVIEWWNMKLTVDYKWALGGCLSLLLSLNQGSQTFATQMSRY